VYLVLTGVLGVLFFMMPVLAGAFRTTHIHLGVLGFFLSMVMGVAYWLMPRPGGLRQERSEAWTFWLLNSGLVVRTIAEPLHRLGGPAWLREVSIVSGLLLLSAIVVFAVAMWARVETAEEIRRIRGVA
jgi:cbb3-type cytochrome oxidase subunit 1